MRVREHSDCSSHRHNVASAKTAVAATIKEVPARRGGSKQRGSSSGRSATAFSPPIVYRVTSRLLPPTHYVQGHQPTLVAS